MIESNSTLPKFYRLSELKEALDEVGHHLSHRMLRYEASRGKINALRTEGGQYRIPEDEFKRIVEARKDVSSRQGGGPRKTEDREEIYFRSIKRRYGVTEEDYKRMESEQGGVCGICGCSPKDDYTHRAIQYQRLHVDHWHDDLGAVRGLLCHNCNFGIGRWLDNPELLYSAIAYIERHSSKKAA